LHIQDQKSSGTDGGTFTSGAWRTRDLNTVVTNEITSASLSSNQITLPAGTYFIIAHAPAFGSLHHKAKLRNVTDSTDTLFGICQGGSSGDGLNFFTSISVVEGRFTIAGTKVFELQHRSTATGSSSGFGKAVSFGDIEVYSNVLIWKVA
jgi:hypothetical protein